MNDETITEEQLEERRKRYVKFVGLDKCRKVPEGCIDVWQVTSYQLQRRKYHGIFDDLDEALAFAESLVVLRLKNGKYIVKDSPFNNIRVSHKAAIQLPSGHFHLVHFNTIRWKGHAPMDEPPSSNTPPSQTTLSHHEQIRSH